MLERDRLSSDCNVDYTQLRDLLATEQWKGADEETGKLMLKITDRLKAGWIREEDIT